MIARRLAWRADYAFGSNPPTSYFFGERQMGA
jgi:hypothetical protein